MVGADVALVSLLFEAVKANWHYGFMIAGVILLIYGVRSGKGISIQLGGGANGNGSGHHIATNGYVSNRRHDDNIAHLNQRLDDHDRDTAQLQKEVGLIREAVQGQGRVLARIEGKLDKQ